MAAAQPLKSKHGGALVGNASMRLEYVDKQREGTGGQLRKLLREKRWALLGAVVYVAAIAAVGVMTPTSVPAKTAHTASLADAEQWAEAGHACGVGTGVVARASMHETGDGEGGDALGFSCEEPALTWKSYLTMAVAGLSLIAMMGDAAADITMLVAMIVLSISGCVSDKAALSGFSNSGVLSVGVLFVVAAAVQESGAVDVVLRAALGRPTSLAVGLVRLLVPVLVLSAFLNNTPVVAMLIPMVESWSQRAGFAKSQLMMPLSFVSMLGGMCTLIGTSTNVILAGLLHSHDPSQSLHLFDVSVVGVPCAMLGLVYLIIMPRCLLRGRRGSGSDSDDDGPSSPSVRSYTTTFKLTSAYEGIPLSATGIPAAEGVEVLAVAAADAETFTPLSKGSDPEVHEGEVVLVAGVPEAIARLRRDRGLRSGAQGVAMLGAGRRHRCLVEVVLDRSSSFVGRAVRDCYLLDDFDAALVGVRLGARARRRPVPKPKRVARRAGRVRSTSTPGTRGGSVQWGTAVTPVTSVDSVTSVEGGTASDFEGMDAALLLGEGGKQAQEQPEKSFRMSPLGIDPRTLLRAGDALLLEVFPSFLRVYSNSASFALVRAVEGSTPPRFGVLADKLRLLFVSALLLTMVMLAAFGTTSLFSAATATAILFVAVKQLTVAQAFQSIKPRLLLAIAAAFGLAGALEETGVAAVLAKNLVGLMAPMGHMALLGSIFLVTSVLGTVISNNANVVLMFPVCLEAHQLAPAVPLKAFVIVLMIAASCSFISPVAYQTNLMVWAPGGYAFADYPKFGAPLQLILAVAAVILTHLFVSEHEV